MHTQAPVGIFDSGFGGLSVARAVRTRLPGENLCYAADCGGAPWGDRTDNYIHRRVDVIVDFLLSRQVKAIVIACNTATAVTVKRLREELKLPIIGIEPAVMLAARETRSRHIGVLATTKTLSSQKYHHLCNRTAEDLHVFDCPCPGLMDCVEAGDMDSPATMALLHRYIDPLIDQGVDTLVLGCTHYPFLASAIRQVAGPGVTLIDPAPAVARQLERRLAETGLLSDKKNGGTEVFYSTDANPVREKVLQTLWDPASRLLNIE